MASSPSDQTAKIIDGKAVAHTIRSEIAEEVRHLSEKHGKVVKFHTKETIFLLYRIVIDHKVISFKVQYDSNDHTHTHTS